jgi:hypothetical protein
VTDDLEPPAHWSGMVLITPLRDMTDAAEDLDSAANQLDR